MNDHGAGEADPEKDALLAALDGQRGHILSMLDGLDEQQLRRSVLPSGWHSLGLVRHLTGVEDYWFRRSANGETTGTAASSGDSITTGGNEADDWAVPEHHPADTVVDRYRRAAARSNEIIEATSLDAPPKWRDPEWRDWGMDVRDLRTILIHVLVETSIHAGHLDATRELIDGRQWVVL